MRDNPILAKFRAALNEMYGEGLSAWCCTAPARAAYLAGLHATQAFIFETTVKVIKGIPACNGNLRG